MSYKSKKIIWGAAELDDNHQGIPLHIIILLDVSAKNDDLGKFHNTTSCVFVPVVVQR